MPIKASKKGAIEHIRCDLDKLNQIQSALLLFSRRGEDVIVREDTIVIDVDENGDLLSAEVQSAGQF